MHLLFPGLDLNSLHNKTEDELVEFWSAVQDATRSLYNTRLFTIAAMDGHSIAAGCILALCCDRRILSRSATIGLNETTFGLVPPPMAAAMMIDVVGMRQAEIGLTMGTIYNAGVL